MSNNLFYRWMKKNLSVSTSLSLDEKIMSMASKKLNSSIKLNALNQWWKPGLALALGISLVIVVNIKNKRHSEIENYTISESPEMLMHYKDIELMSNVGEFSEEDWGKIEGAK